MKFHSSKPLPSNCTLILPSWNSINMINACLDLFIYNTGFKRIGSLESLYSLPMVGSDALGGTNLCSGLEVYLKENTIIIQARSSIVKGKGIKFVQELVEWIASIKTSKVLIVSSADSARKPDGAEDWLAFVNYGFMGIEGIQGIQNIDISVPSYLAVPVGDTLWPVGGGLTRWVFAKLKQEKIQTAALIAFCSQGDIKDILTHMADKMNQILKSGNFRNNL